MFRDAHIFPAQVRLGPDLYDELVDSYGGSTADAMEETIAQRSPLPPAEKPPVGRNAPLAPSQELAYRKKCIQLKRRLKEVEEHNDASRLRIENARRYHLKQRLNRVILLDHLKNMMESGGRAITQDEIDAMDLPGSKVRHAAPDYSGYNSYAGAHGTKRAREEYPLDVSTDEDDVDEPEPSDRPLRSKRAPDSSAPPLHESMTSTIRPGAAPLLAQHEHVYQPSQLPSLQPAHSPFNSLAPKQPAMLTSTFQVNTPISGGAPYPAQTSISAGPATSPFTPFGQHHPSPIAPNISPATATNRNSYSLDGTHPGPERADFPSHPVSSPQYTPYSAPPAPPTGIPSQTDLPAPLRPAPPFEQFTTHMTPQLQRDHYPPEQISERIKAEWHSLSAENRGLWDARYNEQMREYERDMDAWKKRGRRREDSTGGAAGFAAVNR